MNHLFCLKEIQSQSAAEAEAKRAAEAEKEQLLNQLTRQSEALNNLQEELSAAKKDNAVRGHLTLIG